MRNILKAVKRDSESGCDDVVLVGLEGSALTGATRQTISIARSHDIENKCKHAIDSGDPQNLRNYSKSPNDDSTHRKHSNTQLSGKLYAQDP